LTINGNDIVDLSPLNNLTAIQGNLSLTNCANLTSLSGLENITTISGELRIDNLDALPSLTGLDGTAIKDIDGQLLITNNPLLVDITALSGLQTVNGNFSIIRNNLLPNVAGIGQIQKIDGNLNIQSNSALTDCAATCTLFPANVVEGSISISNNKAGCNSSVEVSILCTTSDCPNSSYTLSTQDEVNAFVATFSDCSTKTLQGNLTINRNVTDISGLSFLETITGSLHFDNCDQLASLAGLENLSTIGGFLLINDLNLLTNLEGLNGQLLQEVGNYITIRNCRELIDISALDGLYQIGGNLIISNNIKLPSLKGLDSLALVEGSFIIENNAILSDCSAVCDLVNNGIIENNKTVRGNAEGCNSFEELQILCGEQDTCPIATHTLDTQEEVNAFVATFSNCNTIDGNLTIARTVNDISGLSFLETITGNLNIDNCDQLISLDGLQNISTIGGYLRIYHLDNLTSLEDINGESLKEIGGYLTIDLCRELTDISALEGLSAVDGDILINNNDKLTSLSGLDSLRFVEGQFAIRNNDNLTDCGAICMLINNGRIEGGNSVYSNASGCNSFEEMQILCSSQEDCPIASYTLDR